MGLTQGLADVIVKGVFFERYRANFSSLFLVSSSGFASDQDTLCHGLIPKFAVADITSSSRNIGFQERL